MAPVSQSFVIERYRQFHLTGFGARTTYGTSACDQSIRVVLFLVFKMHRRETSDQPTESDHTWPPRAYAPGVAGTAFGGPAGDRGWIRSRPWLCCAPSGAAIAATASTGFSSRMAYAPCWSVPLRRLGGRPIPPCAECIHWIRRSQSDLLRSKVMVVVRKTCMVFC
jgi:hypothetical protein